MPRSTPGANMRSNRPPIPPAPSQVVEICTSEAAPCGETVKVVTVLERVSDSVRTRPGSGSAISVRYSRVRPPAVSLYRRTVPAPTPPDSTWKSENAGVGAGTVLRYKLTAGGLHPAAGPISVGGVRSRDARPSPDAAALSDPA